MVVEYCEHINNFALYLRYAKSERYLFELIDKNNRLDLYQIIALSALEGESEKEVNVILKREMYYFATRILGYRKVKENQRPYSEKGYMLKKTQVCDLCGRESHHAHYKSFIPNKSVCRLCYNKIKKRDARRNSN